MFYTNTTFIGIDPTAGRRPFSFAAIGHDLQILALAEGDIDEVLAFVGGQRRAFVAVNAPSRPNQGLMKLEEVRSNLSPVPRPGRWENFRVAEYLLRQHNILTPNTPEREENCPGWMRMGFALYRRLREFGYQSLPIGEAELYYLEVYPHAAFACLLGLNPFHKHTLEGRLQRQLILLEVKLNVPDAMRVFEEITRYRLLKGVLPEDGLYNPGELDALVAAYTAWAAAHEPQEVLLLGDSREGQIVLPVPALKEHY